MDLTLFINSILNQIFNFNKPNNTSNNNNNSSNHGQVVQRPIENSLKPFIDFYKYLGILAVFHELLELLKRFMDKVYTQSRIYECTGSTRHYGKVAVMTDATQGVGAEITCQLSKIGYKVIVGIKEVQKGSDQTTRSLSELTKGSNNIKLLKLNLSSLESVREFAKEVVKIEPKIDLLINSADQTHEQILTQDGIEKNFQENYLAHFLLSNLLIPNLKKSENGRVVNISSVVHYFTSLNLDHINNTFFKIPVRAYARSKLANVLFTRELSRRLSDTKITTYVVSPEMIKKHEIFENIPILSKMFSRIIDPVIGVQTLLYVSLEESLRNESGFYYSNLKKVHPLPLNGSDDNLAKQLWNMSEELVKLNDETNKELLVIGQSSE